MGGSFIKRFTKRFVKKGDNSERGDFTVALVLFSVILLSVASLSYVWPKASSTRFTVSYAAEEALKASIITAKDNEANLRSVRDTAMPLESSISDSMRSFLERYRIHGVQFSVQTAECFETSVGWFIRATVLWYFDNNYSLVGVPGGTTTGFYEASQPDQQLCALAGDV